jgi:minor histocompatibility antigen H13
MSSPWAAYAALLAMACAPIYVGSLRSARPSQKVETISSRDAYLFPVYASAALFTLYVVFRLVAADIVNLLLTAYIVLLASVSVANALRPLLHDVHPLLSGGIGAAVAVAYLLTKHWLLNNAIGLCLAVTGVEFLGLPSFKVGAIMLCGLFVYDVFWVFGTDVMVSVATKFDAPIKLIFPRDPFAAELKFAMLGLGDIVIPGLFIALMYRFDLHQSARRREDPPRPRYFRATLLAYITGLAACIVAMQLYQAAQPALLYLVPACLGTALGLAGGRGEWADLMAYHEEHPQDEAPAPDLPWKEQLAKVYHEVFLGRAYKPTGEAAAKQE